MLGRRVRVEHWANALNQPAVAAKTMLGSRRRYDRLPYFFTDQYDLGMEYAGPRRAGRRTTGRSPRRPRRPRVHRVLAAREGRVLAGMNVNVWDVTDQIRELILSGKPADAFTMPAS